MFCRHMMAYRSTSRRTPYLSLLSSTLVLVLVILITGSRGAAATLPAMLPPSGNNSVPLLDPNKTPYPRSALHDFADLLDAPAGKHGFLTVRGEHFVWRDGSRARFWGINVANTSLQEPNADIDAIIENFRTAGFNLLRLHHFDERGGIIDLDARDSQHFEPSHLKKLDYWIYRAKQAGIYVYLDLLDYRRFKVGDGVPNPDGIGRAGRPYAVFDPRLIELQKQYALQLLKQHVNPYTGLAYIDDPAIVMIELYDESGLFMRRGVWREMPQPYADNFKRMWNDWLRARYKTTSQLSAAWTSANGVTALEPGESLEAGTVEVPAMTWTPERLPAAQQRWAALPRRDDGACFAYELHKRYFRTMRDYLRSIGAKVPISATGRFEDLADLKSVSEELDFVGCNFYYDHPYWGAKAPSWQPPSFFHNHNPMSDVDDRSMAAAVSLARIKGRPFVVREWNYCWPNRNRASGMIEAACYAALHDIDAMILFVYETKPTACVSYFNVRSDPSRWGLCGVCSQIFLKGLIRPSLHRIVVPYGPVDTFTYTRYHQPFYALGWATRMENDFFEDGVYRVRQGSGNDLILTPGRSGLGRYEGAPAVLHCEDLRRDLAGRRMAIPEYLEDYKLSTVPTGVIPLLYDGLMLNNGVQRNVSLSLGLPLDTIVANGYRPIGYNTAAGVAHGMVDMVHKRFVFGALDPFDVQRAALDAMQVFHGVPNDHDATEQNVFTTDTGEMLRDAASGRLVVSAPQVQALCGNLTGVGRVLAPGLRVRNLKSGTLVALALDGKPLVDSRRFMVKMVTDARNADEISGPDPRFAQSSHGPWRCDVLGAGPVTTFGRASASPIEISIERRPVLDVYLDRGSFELLVDGDNWQFYCDTPGARFTMHREPSTSVVVQSDKLGPTQSSAQAGGQGPAGAVVQGATNNGAAPGGLQQVTLDGTIKPLHGTGPGHATVAVYPPQAALVRSVG